MRPPECPQCLRTILPEDTIVFGSWPSRSLRLSSASCTERRRAHDALYELPHHPLAACVRCAERFHLRDVASIDLRGVRAYSCPWCHTDPTDSIRVHLYGCAMLPAEVLERARQAREAARQLVKNRLQRRDHAGCADARDRSRSPRIAPRHPTVPKPSTCARISGATRDSVKPRGADVLKWTPTDHMQRAAWRLSKRGWLFAMGDQSDRHWRDWSQSCNRMDRSARRPKMVLLAWVLWSQLVGFTRPDGQPEQVWLRLQFFQSAVACRENLNRFMTYDLSEAAKLERQRGSSVTRYPDGYRISNPTLGTHEVHFQCLPAGEDPRWLKTH
jgi:hypothetical protein